MPLSAVPEYEPERIDRTGDRAIVVGGSMAGLVAGRVLADAYESVAILDRDPLPDERVARRGVPQSNHAHAMLEAGRATLEALFPGFSEEIVSAGGVEVDMGSDFRHYEHGGAITDTPAELPMYCATRPLIEQVVRHRMLNHDRVRLRSECHVNSYLTDDGDETVEGVSFVAADGQETELSADLVVDATGRTSHTPEWLEQHGYESPPVDEVSVDLAYTTTTIQRPPDDNRVFLVAPTAPDPRGGTAVPVENDRWLVTLFGVHGEHAPTDIEGFERYAERLSQPDLARLLDNHEYVDGNIERYPFPSSLRRRYEQLDRFPDGLLVTGDAIASFNPVYGQGMSVAALDAMQLHRALASGERQALAIDFFDGAATAIDTAWRMAVGSDFDFAETSGPKPTGTDLFNRYVARVMETTHTDPAVATQFYHVMRMEEPPTRLLRPRILARVGARSLLDRCRSAGLPAVGGSQS